jgi:hypothetical protein
MGRKTVLLPIMDRVDNAVRLKNIRSNVYMEVISYLDGANAILEED